MLELINILNKYFIIDVFWVVFSAIPAIAVFAFLKGKIRKRRLIYTTLFVFYVTLVLSYTVLSRSLSGTAKCQLEFLWSYKEARFNPELLLEIILNYILFVPIGLMFAGALKNSNKYKLAVVFGFLFSLTIELLQLISTTGLFEFDDILGNTLGTLIGCTIYFLHRRFRTSRKVHHHRHHSYNSYYRTSHQHSHSHRLHT